MSNSSSQQNSTPESQKPQAETPPETANSVTSSTPDLMVAPPAEAPKPPPPPTAAEQRAALLKELQKFIALEPQMTSLLCLLREALYLQAPDKSMLFPGWSAPTNKPTDVWMAAKIEIWHDGQRSDVVDLKQVIPNILAQGQSPAAPEIAAAMVKMVITGPIQNEISAIIERKFANASTSSERLLPG